MIPIDRGQRFIDYWIPSGTGVKAAGKIDTAGRAVRGLKTRDASQEMRNKLDSLKFA
jgi:hypothetical protein